MDTKNYWFSCPSNNCDCNIAELFAGMIGLYQFIIMDDTSITIVYDNLNAYELLYRYMKIKFGIFFNFYEKYEKEKISTKKNITDNSDIELCINYIIYLLNIYNNLIISFRWRGSIKSQSADILNSHEWSPHTLQKTTNSTKIKNISMLLRPEEQNATPDKPYLFCYAYIQENISLKNVSYNSLTQLIISNIKLDDNDLSNSEFISTLNPNAQEFVPPNEQGFIPPKTLNPNTLNPNARVFIPPDMQVNPDQDIIKPFLNNRNIVSYNINRGQKNEFTEKLTSLIDNNSDLQLESYIDKSWPMYDTLSKNKMYILRIINPITQTPMQKPLSEWTELGTYKKYLIFIHKVDNEVMFILKDYYNENNPNPK